MIFRFAWMLVAPPLLSSCGVPYAMVSGTYVASEANVTVELPQGWRQHNISTDPMQTFTAVLDKRHKLSWDLLRLTRDGLLLQQICIGRIPVTDELPNTKRKLGPQMIPLEAAEVMNDDLRSNSNLLGLEISENVPATVGGYPGFKLHYTYRADDLKIEGLFYGAMAGSWLYYLFYEAPAQHYFAKDLQVFDKLRASFVIGKQLE
jgi:hypothetical protein